MDARIRHQAGGSILGFLFFLFVIYLFWAFLFGDGTKSIDAHAEALQDRLQAFSGQKGVAQQAYEEALSAKDTAVAWGLNFKNPKTQQFINKWSRAEDKVRALRSQLDRIKTSAQSFFVKLDTELASISDPALRARMNGLVRERTLAFSRSIANADRAIGGLETSIQKGTDVITALNIAGALGALDLQVQELDVISKTAASRFDEIDQMVAEGMSVLNLELGQ